MALDFTANLRLRTPKASDRVDNADFDRFFTGNMTTIDSNIQRLTEAVELLNETAALSGDVETVELTEAVAELRTALENLNHDFSTLSVSVLGLSNRVVALETNGVNTAAINSLRNILAGYGERIAALEKSAFGAAASPDVSSLKEPLADTRSALDSLSVTVAALEDNANANFTVLQNKVNALETEAFAALRKGGDGLWYAYNRSGGIVDGPFEPGFMDNGKTWADFFGTGDDTQTVDYPDPAPIVYDSPPDENTETTLARFLGVST